MQLREPLQFIRTMLSSGPVADEFRINNRLAYHVYKTLRSRLLRQEYNKNYFINPQNFTLFCVCLDKVDHSENSTIYKTGRKWRRGEVPSFVLGRNRAAVDNVRTTAGVQIDLTEDQDNRYRKYGNNTSKNYGAFFRNNDIVIDGPNDDLERVYINALVDDPVSLLTMESCEDDFFGSCISALEMETYLDNYLLDYLYGMSYEALIKVFMQLPEDLLNDNKQL